MFKATRILVAAAITALGVVACSEKTKVDDHRSFSAVTGAADATATPNPGATPSSAPPPAATQPANDAGPAAHAVTNETYTINKVIGVQTEPASNTVTYMLVDPSQSVLKLGDRFYVASVLSQTFGPPAAPVIASLINGNAQAFGAPCDPYARPGINDCPISNSLSQAPPNPVSTAARAAYMTRACEGIAVLDPAISFAAKQISSADITKVTPADADIDAAYGLFFPSRKDTDGEHAALQALIQSTMAQPNALPINAWRHLLLAICLAPRWQLY